MDQISKFNVVHRFRKRSLLIAINCVAGLSIFFFGYDQGMMGGVNGAYDYYHNTMKFGIEDEQTQEPIVQNALLQGGIVRSFWEHWNRFTKHKGLGLLFGHAGGLPRWRLVRRSLWPDQDDCARGWLGSIWS